MENEHLSAFCTPKVESALLRTLGPFGSIWAHLAPLAPPSPPRGGLGCGRLAGGGWGGGGARDGWAASGARSGERRPPLSGSGASAPEVVPLHSYPRRGLTGITNPIYSLCIPYIYPKYTLYTL